MLQTYFTGPAVSQTYYTVTRCVTYLLHRTRCVKDLLHLTRSFTYLLHRDPMCYRPISLDSLCCVFHRLPAASQTFTWSPLLEGPTESRIGGDWLSVGTERLQNSRSGLLRSSIDVGRRTVTSAGGTVTSVDVAVLRFSEVCLGYLSRGSMVRRIRRGAVRRYWRIMVTRTLVKGSSAEKSAALMSTCLGTQFLTLRRVQKN